MFQMKNENCSEQKKNRFFSPITFDIMMTPSSVFNINVLKKDGMSLVKLDFCGGRDGCSRDDTQ